MKIEKVNENQIRCTLTREDLANRELKISELAYGTEKAKTLFRDMMQQANFEFGFEAEDIPLMIEAIPLNAECIVLIITKVEDPEELDTRFSRFAPSGDEEETDFLDEEDDRDEDSPSQEVMDLFRRIQDNHKAALPGSNAAAQKESQPEAELTRIYVFDSLRQVIELAALAGPGFTGKSVLYKEESTGKYLLSLVQGDCDAVSFNKICNLLSEYGTYRKAQPASRFYLEEHLSVLVGDHALQSLAGI